MSSSPGSHLLQIKFPLCHHSPGVLSLRDWPRSELALPPTHLYHPPASAGRTGLGACLASLGPRRPVSCLAHGRCPRSTGSPSLPRGALGRPCEHPAVVQDGSPFHTPLPVPRPRPRCPVPPVSSPTVKGKTLVLPFSFEQRWSRNKGRSPEPKSTPPPSSTPQLRPPLPLQGSKGFVYRWSGSWRGF